MGAAGSDTRFTVRRLQSELSSLEKLEAEQRALMERLQSSEA